MQVNCLAWNCDGRKLATGADDNSVRLWSIERHSHVRPTHQLQASVVCLESLKTEADKAFWMYCVQGKPEKADSELKGHNGDVVTVAWDPNSSNRLASAATDKFVRYEWWLNG